MLTAKQVKIHKMSDERWTMKDKMNQYRGVLKLYARDKKIRASELTKLKQRVLKNLKSLQTDVREYRDIVSQIVTGNKIRLLPILKRYDNFHLAFGQLDPDELHKRIYQNSELYHRQLDKLRYEKEKLAKKFFDLQLEKCLLMEMETEDVQTDRIIQHLMAYLQQSTAKQNGVKAIRITYLTIINILKKDAIYFDALLKAVRDDKKDQCKVIVKTMIMGQLVAENVDDLKQKYKLMTIEVVKNMKERERTLIITRERVADLWEYAKSLVRIESDTVLAKEDINEENFAHLENQLKRLEEICDILKDTILVRSYNELFPRLEEQLRQKTRLINQFNYNIKERDDLLSKKEEALTTLENLEHTMVTSTGQYRIDKKAILEEIETQKKRIIEYKDQRRSHGELSIKITAALQNMLLMLICVKHIKGAIKEKVTKKQAKAVVIEKVEIEDIREPSLEKVETDVTLLFTQLTRAMSILFGISNFELDKEKNERAKQLYQNYVADYISNFTFGKDVLESALIVEHEIIDPNVLTRTDVKNQSRRMVEANVRYN
ncbi:myosin-9-like isoform X1 [Vespula squamosa]|uniref:Myosin-9-like isoform X1 n=1 Tax=Vespula squamosa TaxID=30214 RepID=A0ABD2A176_VESSQ